jgi:hypothetical protein
MKIKLVGKTTATVGNAILKVRGRSGKKYPFHKKPKQGYIYDAVDNSEVLDLFEAQASQFAYFFSPVLSEDSEKEIPEISVEGLKLADLKELCDKLGIPTIPQDKERSLTRMIEAYKLGASS